MIYRKLRLVAAPAAFDSVCDLVTEHEPLAALTDALEAAADNLLPDDRVEAAPSQIKANGCKFYKYTNKDALAKHIEEAARLAGR